MPISQILMLPDTDGSRRHAIGYRNLTGKQRHTIHFLEVQDDRQSPPSPTGWYCYTREPSDRWAYRQTKSWSNGYVLPYADDTPKPLVLLRVLPKSHGDRAPYPLYRRERSKQKRFPQTSRLPTRRVATASNFS